MKLKITDTIALGCTAVCVVSVSLFGDEPPATAQPSVEPQLQRGESIAEEYIVSDPYLPCLDPSATTDDCRTWEGYPRAHHGIDVAGGEIDTSSKRLTVPGVKGQTYRVSCHGDRHSSKGYGLYADIEINGHIARWGHLSACYPGDLKAGAPFAISGNSGYSTGAHIDYATIDGGVNIPPKVEYLEQSLTGKVLAANIEAELDALYWAIVEKESGNNPAAINPDSGAIGIGQVMPANVPSWTQQCLGRSLTPDQFRRDVGAQQKTIRCRLAKNLDTARQKYPRDRDAQVRCVAAIWYSGQCALKNSTRPQPYGENVYDSVEEYTMDVLALFKRLKRHRSPP